MASDLFANASLFTPPEPDLLEKLDINEQVITGLIMRLMHLNTSMVAHEIAAEICLPFFNIVEPVLNVLRDNRLLEITRGDMAAVSYVYGITDAGRARALQYFEQSTYVGARARLGRDLRPDYRRAKPSPYYGPRRAPARRFPWTDL